MEITKKQHVQTKTIVHQSNFAKKQKKQAITFLEMQTISDICEFLDLPHNDLKNMVEFPEYTSFTISKKNGGSRTIHAPAEKLKRAQKKINSHLQSIYFFKKSLHSHGFVIQNKSIEKKPNIFLNAQPHVRSKYLLNVDIKDFFGSISANKINLLFLSDTFRFPKRVSETLTLLCTFNKQLPQGSPASPVLSNLICQNLDKDLHFWAEQNDLIYTRYADDLSFSAGQPFSEKHIETISEILGAYGFKINPRKLRLSGSNKKMRVTGLIVNTKINVDRRYLKRVRAMLHDAAVNGLKKASKTHFQKEATTENMADRNKLFLQRIQGSVAFIGQIRGEQDTVYLKFISELQSIQKNLKHSN